MFCKNCGKELKDGNRFCEHCGARVEEDTGQLQKEESQEITFSAGKVISTVLSMAGYFLLAFGPLCLGIWYFLGHSGTNSSGDVYQVTESHISESAEEEELPADGEDQLQANRDMTEEQERIPEQSPTVSAETDVVWEGTWQRTLGPAAAITIFTADEGGIFFAASIGSSGYDSYIDMRDCTAGWIVAGKSAHYGDVFSGYDLEFSYENGVLIVNESVANASGLNLSGTYVPESKADYPSCEYVFADSDEYEIYEGDCEGLTALECRIAKNEIYARHGRRFNDESLQDYFDSCSWYDGYMEPEDFTEDMLNDVEQANLQVISSYEAYMGF